MAAWNLQGTPSLVVFDRAGRLRLKHFGRLDDLPLGAMLGQLLAQPTAQEAFVDEDRSGAESCTSGACGVVIP